MNKRDQNLIKEEILFKYGKEVILTTGLRGVVTYIISVFYRITGYTLLNEIKHEKLILDNGAYAIVTKITDTKIHIGLVTQNNYKGH